MAEIQLKLASNLLTSISIHFNTWMMIIRWTMLDRWAQQASRLTFHNGLQLIGSQSMNKMLGLQQLRTVYLTNKNFLKMMVTNIRPYNLRVEKLEVFEIWFLQLKPFYCHYRPRPKVGEGTVFTGVYLFTSGGTPSTSHNTFTDLMSFLGVLQWLVPGPFWGYPSPRQGVPQSQVGGGIPAPSRGYPSPRKGVSLSQAGQD